MSDDDEAAAEPMIAQSTHRKRIDQKTAKIDQLQAKLTDTEARLTDTEARLTESPDAAKILKRLTRAEGERDKAVEDLEAHRTESASRAAMFGAGITDPEDQELVRWRWERTPEDKRGELSDYLAKDAKEDRLLKHLFTSDGVDSNGTDDDTAAPAMNRKPKRDPLPRTSRDVVTKDAPPRALSLEAIMAMPASERLKPENRERIAAAIKA